MKIIQDSRETLPLTFNHPYINGVKVEKLEVGDYMVEFKDGYRPPLSFERKSHADLWGSLATKKGHERFKAMIERAKEHKIELILIVEKSYSRVEKGYSYKKKGKTVISKFSGLSMIRLVFTLWARYNLIPVFCSNREEMSQYISEKFFSEGKEYLRRKKNG